MVARGESGQDTVEERRKNMSTDGRTWSVQSGSVIDQQITPLLAVRTIELRITISQTFCDEEWPTLQEIAETAAAALREKY
jgi:hypothetical protein